MIVENVCDHIRYTLTNENLEIGDPVFPIGSGRITPDGFVFHKIKFNEALTDFPYEPHIILSFKPYNENVIDVQTNCGSSAKDCYFKIIKKEQQVCDNSRGFPQFNWVEIF